MKKYTWTPENCSFFSESEVHPHIDKEKAHLFESADGGTTEYEVLNWLHATILAIKPNLVLETGAWNGFGTIALAHACKSNNLGHVHSLEIDPSQCVRVESFLEEERLKKWATVHNTNSIDWLNNTNLTFDIGFFDSLTEIRAEEAKICVEKKMIKVAVFHDTSKYRSESAADWTSQEEQENYRTKIFELAKHPSCTGYLDSSLSRGFIALFFKD